MQSLLFRITALLRSLDEQTGLGDLDYTSRDMLFFVGERTDSGEPPRVSEVTLDGRFGSAATAHAKLNELVEQGWLKRAPGKVDKRERILILTRKAEGIFKQFATAMAKLR
jgi:DNA-binding MarR family transcriptional regulator